MTQRRTGADGVIVGTALKRGDETTNPVSGERAAAIVTAARAAGSTDWSPIAASTRPADSLSPYSTGGPRSRWAHVHRLVKVYQTVQKSRNQTTVRKTSLLYTFLTGTLS